MKYWLNRDLVQAQKSDLDSDGWPLGSGIFETIRTENSQVYELGRHMRRAASAAKHFGLKLPDEEFLRSAIGQLLESEPQTLGRLRLLFSQERFVAVHQPYVEIITPAKLMKASQDFDSNAIEFKTFPYTHRLSLLARAKEASFDEVICFTINGSVSEGAVSNFIFQIGGEWITTPLSAGVLPGVQRAIVIERCGVIVRSLTNSDLDKVDRGFVISSLKIALAVSVIDDRRLVIDEESANFAQKIRAHTHKHSVG